jgi:hypothetical protein
MTFKSFVKEQDYFGHQIQLQIGEGNTSYNTYIGGLWTLFVKVIMILLIGSYAFQMLTFSNPDIKQGDTFLDESSIYLNGTGFVPIFALFDIDKNTFIKYD